MDSKEGSRGIWPREDSEKLLGLGFREFVVFFLNGFEIVGVFLTQPEPSFVALIFGKLGFWSQKGFEHFRCHRRSL